MKMSGWFWNIAARTVRREIARRFEYSFDDLDLGNMKGPLFIVTNHVCAWDPFLVAMAFHDRQIAFVASEHILRMPRIGKIVEKYTDVIPHKKAGGGTKTTIECLRRLKNGESIFIASEGEQSWDGISGSVVASTGKLLKKSGASIVTLRFEGGYLAMPRWADNTRRGKIHLKYVNTYAAEDVAKMTPEEIKESINRDLYFNVWDWQREATPGMHRYIPKSGGLADGIERFLFMCPACKTIGALTSNGDEVSCACGFKTKIMDTGFFNPSVAFETIAEWNKWQEGELDKMLDGAGEFFADSKVELVKIENGHDENEVASGCLVLEREGGELFLKVAADSVSRNISDSGIANIMQASEGVRFALSEIESMAMILYNRIVFSVNDVYYEIRPKNMKGRMNLRKYIVAWKKRGGREE